MSYVGSEVTISDFEIIRQAVAGDHGDDQRVISVLGLKIVEMLLLKNRDYGSSAWKRPMLSQNMTAREAIQCRMSDKIERLAMLLSGNEALVQESIEDTMRDLAGYAILWLGAK